MSPLRKILDNLKPKFIKGGKTNGHDEEILEKIHKEIHTEDLIYFNLIQIFNILF